MDKLFFGVAGAAVAGIAAYWYAKNEEREKLRPAPVSRAALQRQRQSESSNSNAVEAPPSYDEAVSEDVRTLAQKKFGVDSVNHINVCFAGTTGVGKSTLINAFRGIPNRHPLAARTGAVQETTMRMQRYDFPEYKAQALHTLSLLKLWDVPGSGTENFSWTDYFANMHLYVFDFIVIVCSDRVTEADVELAMQAYNHQIPFAFVRSRADEAITRYKNDVGEQDDMAAAKKIKDLFNRTCCDKMRAKGVTEIPATYLISAYAMQDPSGSCIKIDEEKLLRDVIRTVVQRRYH